eukprot:GHVO01034502.1.p1 GENE.GHVO01034502.1~~GHVO01034502.1.p1  ORF type:complete len:129 (-),score=0.32 GHVO01034502.1:42-428(-)
MTPDERKTEHRYHPRGLKDSPQWSAPYRIVTIGLHSTTARGTLSGAIRTIARHKVRLIPTDIPKDLYDLGSLSLACARRKETHPRKLSPWSCSNSIIYTAEPTRITRIAATRLRRIGKLNQSTHRRRL